MSLRVLAPVCLALAVSAPASAGWLSEALNGRAPPLNKVLPCAVNAAACATTEGLAEHQRQQQMQADYARLQQAVARDQAIINELSQRAQANNAAERAEYRAALNWGQTCYANARVIEQADNCYSSVYSQMLEIQRRYSGW